MTEDRVVLAMRVVKTHYRRGMELVDPESLMETCFLGEEERYAEIIVCGLV